MKFVSKFGDPASVKTACLVVPRAGAKALADDLGVGEQAALALAASKGAAGRVATILRDGQPARLLAVGKEREGRGESRAGKGGKGGNGKADSAANFRKDMAAVAKALAAIDVADATLCLDDFAVADKDLRWKAATALAAISHESYRFNAHKSKRQPALKLRRVGVLGGDRAAVRDAVRHAQALDEGLTFAKDLGNQPPNVCTPTYLAAQAEGLAADGVDVQVLEESQMAELGMGAFLSVTQGTETPAKLIVVDYRGGEKNDAPSVLVGKGITFDTGGLNLKGGASMGDMKFDMCGAACVLGVAKAAIAAKLPINLVAIAAAAENMPSGTATRPSDIVTTMSKQTVEILNTDAEGRLVLCDALTYAKRFKPKAVIDVATLTGAQVVALGSAASALYANDDELAATIVDAGETAGDRLWRMPLWDEYQQQLKSNFADMKNIGGREAGSITAACFLSRFAKGMRWAHLDVAGTAFKANKGSTGRPVPALFQWLLDAAA